MKYLLDSNIISYALRSEGHVAAQIGRHRRSILAISVITVAELRFGWQRSGSSKLRSAIETFCQSMTVLDFDRAAAQCFADLAAVLVTRGTPIGTQDAMIAGHALATKLTLVTHNTKHFHKVPGLKLDDWY